MLAFGYSIEYRGRDAFIDEVYINEAHRGRGLGREVFEAAIVACREAGARAVHLEVERDHRAAQVLYRRLGFDDHDRYLMTRLLDDNDGAASNSLNRST